MDDQTQRPEYAPDINPDIRPTFGPALSEHDKDPSINDKSVSAENLRSAEEKGATTDSAGAAANQELHGRDSETLGKGFNPEGSAKSRRFGIKITKRRAAVGAGIAGLVGGGLFSISFIGSGPFQFIHLAQSLTHFHFSSQQDASDDRTFRIFRFINDARKGQVERTRMGMVGNKVADIIEKRMNATGIQSAYTDQFGNFDGYVIDPANEHFKGMTTDEIKQYFKDTYGISISEGAADSKLAGTLVIDASNLGLFKSYLQNKAIVRSMLQESGYSKVASTLGARIMGARAGISWHPLSSLDTKIQGAVESWWRSFNDSVENGAKPEFQQNNSQQKNETQQQQAEQTATEGAATDITQEAQSVTSPTDPNGTAKVKASIQAKLAIGGSALVGIACVAYGVAQNASNLKQAQVVLPLTRLGMDTITVGNQVMSGQEVDPQELDKLQQSLYDPATNQSWADAQSIQAEEGDPLTGKDATPTMKTAGDPAPLSSLRDGGIGTVLGGVCSSVGQGILTVLSFLGGPISAAVNYLGGVAAEPLINFVTNDLASWLIGNPINASQLKGADYGNAVNYGARLAADQQAIAAGGIALTADQSAQLKGIETIASQQQFNSRGLAYRLFNPYDNRTLTSHVLDSLQPSLTKNVASFDSGLFHIGSALAHQFGSLFSHMVHANPVTPYSYGFPEFGFSTTDLNNSLVANPFQNAGIAATILDNNGKNGEPDYIDLGAKCFGVNIAQQPDPDGSGQLTWSVGGGITPISLDDVAKQDCTRSGDNNWLRLRFFIFDTENMESIGCYHNDAESCSDIDMNNGNTSVSYIPSVPVQSPDVAIQSLSSRAVSNLKQGTLWAIDTLAA